MSSARLVKEHKELGQRGKKDAKGEIVLFPVVNRFPAVSFAACDIIARSIAQNDTNLFNWTAYIHGSIANWR
jgi:hypothetical protein